jgi:hypothetical protein
MKWFSRRGGRKELRRSRRFETSGVVASYWNGGAARPQPVRDLSLTGTRVETPDRYYPDTLIYVCLEAGAGAEPAPEDSFGLWARVVRRVPDGLGLEFVFEDRQELKEFRRFLARVEHRSEDGKSDPGQSAGAAAD